MDATLLWGRDTNSRCGQIVATNVVAIRQVLGPSEPAETPYSINVVPKDLLENFQATTSPRQVLKKNPTTQLLVPESIGNNEGGSVGINMRGFGISTYARNGVGQVSGYGFRPLIRSTSKIPYSFYANLSFLVELGRPLDRDPGSTTIRRGTHQSTIRLRTRSAPTWKFTIKIRNHLRGASLLTTSLQALRGFVCELTTHNTRNRVSRKICRFSVLQV